MKQKYLLNMRVCFLLFIAVFFQSIFTQQLVAQTLDQSKHQFEKVFEKETQLNKITGYGKFKNIERLSFYPDTLPSWFFKMPKSTATAVYAIGISDPDLTPKDAAFQALHRAKSLAVLYDKALIQYYRDVYTLDNESGGYKSYGQRFDTYFKLSSTTRADSNCFEVVQTYCTRYNEAVVLVRFNPSVADVSSKCDQITTVGTALYIEAQIGDVFESQAEYDFFTNHKTHLGVDISSHFTYREKGKRFLSVSNFLGNTFDYPIYNYKYSNPSWAKNTDPLISFNGLWSIYSKKFLQQLTLETQETSVYIKNLDESYASETRNLIREVAIKKAQLQINGIEFGVDSIVFDLHIIELNQ